MKKYLKHIGIFLCIFTSCGTALWGAWQLWFNPYRSTASVLRPSEELETVLTSQQAVEDLDYLVQRLAVRHPACINALPDTVVGEVPGNMPSSYGDILYFQTPNARLVFTVSYKYFIRPDASKSDLPLIPDVTVPAKDALTETIRLIEKAR